MVYEAHVVDEDDSGDDQSDGSSQDKSAADSTSKPTSTSTADATAEPRLVESPRQDAKAAAGGATHDSDKMDVDKGASSA